MSTTLQSQFESDTTSGKASRVRIASGSTGRKNNKGHYDTLACQPSCAGTTTEKQANGKLDSHLPDWQQRLADRGILDAALSAGWEAHKHKGKPGWRYPVCDLQGRIQTYRWKAQNQNSRPKYLWLKDKPVGCDYYFPPQIDLKRAVADAHGVLYIAAGELDLLTFVSAGFPNVLSWFGEGSIPHNLPGTLASLGVTQLVYLPDLDPAGLESACKVRDALAGTEIRFEARKLPNWLPSKGDTNDLWQAHGFNIGAFRDALGDAPVLKLPEPNIRSRTNHRERKARRRPNSSQVDWKAERGIWWREVVMPALDAVAPVVKREGKIERRRCPNPWHKYGDRHPSLRISVDKDSIGYPMCTCLVHDEKDARDLVAGWVGAPSFLKWWKSERQQLYRQAKRGNKGVGYPKIKFGQNGSVTIGKKTFETSSFPADVTVHMRYISDLSEEKIKSLLNYGAILIKSAINTGKTTLVKKVITVLTDILGYKPRVLVITHRSALAEDIARSLGLTCYKNKSFSELRQAAGLVIVSNSLRKLMGGKGRLPRYDVIVIDEIEQFFYHFDSNTFRKGRAAEAYQICQQLAKAAQAVIGLDAHASAISKEWLEKVKGADKVVALENTYQLHRGKLTLHSTPESVVARVLLLATSQDHPIIVPTNSRKEAKRLAALFRQSLGEDAVIAIHSETSESSEVQAFIQNINVRLAQVKVLVYSPSLGTGVDITVPAYVCGVLYSRPLDAPDCLQMLGRCRNPIETHAFVRYAEIPYETDWYKLYKTYLKRVRKTGVMCEFDEYNVFQPTASHRALLELVAKLTGERHQSQNNLFANFLVLARASGYELEFYHEEADEMQRRMEQVRANVAQEDKSAVLAAEPVRYDQLETHRRNGTLTPEVRAGHTRFQIEDMVGCSITPELYDLLHELDAREKFKRFTHLLEKVEAVQKVDRQQARDKRLHTKLDHNTAHASLIGVMLRNVFGRDDLYSIDKLTREEIEKPMRQFLALEKDDLQTFMDWRPDQSQDPVAVLRWLLAKVNLQLKSKQVTQKGQRQRVYWIDPERRHLMLQFARLRLQHLAQGQRGQEATPPNPDSLALGLNPAEETDRTPQSAGLCIVADAQGDITQSVESNIYHTPRFEDTPSVEIAGTPHPGPAFPATESGGGRGNPLPTVAEDADEEAAVCLSASNYKEAEEDESRKVLEHYHKHLQHTEPLGQEGFSVSTLNPFSTAKKGTATHTMIQRRE